MLRLSPLEFLDRLAALVPPPRVHRHRYHGALAPNRGPEGREGPRSTKGWGSEGWGVNSPLRPLVTTSAAEEPNPPLPGALPPRRAPPSTEPKAASRTHRVSSRWATLLARIYHTFPLVCPGHRAKRGRGQTMRLLTFLTDPFSIRRVLPRAPREAWSGEPTRPPKLHPPRGPPEIEFGFDLDARDGVDQTPSFDPAEPAPIPEFDMDPTRAG